MAVVGELLTSDPRPPTPSQYINARIENNDDRFTMDNLVDCLNDTGQRVGMVIDLTNTTRYYNPSILKSKDIEHTKILTEGHIVPSKAVRRKFFQSIESFLAKNKKDLIGVHCTHGVNRTGYLVCKYMITHLNIDPKQAIADFNKARGHDLERSNYIADLWNTKPSTNGLSELRSTEERVHWKDRSRSHDASNSHPRQNSQLNGHYSYHRPNAYDGPQLGPAPPVWPLNPSQNAYYQADEARSRLDLSHDPRTRADSRCRPDSRTGRSSGWQESRSRCQDTQERFADLHHHQGNGYGGDDGNADRISRANRFEDAPLPTTPNDLYYVGLQPTANGIEYFDKFSSYYDSSHQMNILNKFASPTPYEAGPSHNSYLSENRQFYNMDTQESMWQNKFTNMNTIKSRNQDSKNSFN